MLSLLTIGAAFAVVYLSSFIYCLTRNFLNARKTGLPSVIVPWDQNHFLWMLTSVPLWPWLRRQLPKFIYNRLVLCIYGWEYHEKLRPFEEYAGPCGNDKTFMLVTCGKLELWTKDPDVAVQVLGRPGDFVQFKLAELFMAVFGHNVLTTNGDRWARQRKIVASVINERISKAVFIESVKQTRGLIEEVTSTTSDGSGAETNKFFDMAKKITVHVLSGAGMGATVSWQDDATERPPNGFEQTYIQSVKTVLNNITGPILLPRWFLRNYPSFVPGHTTMRSLGYAVEEFLMHTASMLDKERERMKAKGSVSRSNIMSQLVQASEQVGDTKTSSTKDRVLSDEELMGNLFVFTGAGFDTTANTVSFALVLLARYPRWQDWLLEEVDEIITPASTEDLDYVTTFPRATRLMAFMLETLRLFTPLIHISKQTETPQPIQTLGGAYWLPANTTVYINTVALHLDPAVWLNLNLPEGEEGSKDDVQRFRPTRWINPLGSQQSLFQPPKGSYLPWSMGPRICPGQKMAQVEFVGIFLTLLSRHRISAVALDNESTEAMEQRLDTRMKDSISVLTLQMRNVYDVSESNDKGLMLRLSKRR